MATEVNQLVLLDLDALRSRWLGLTGKPAPKGFRRDLLIRALAYEIQVAAFGSLSPALKRRLRQLAIAAREDRFDDVLGTSLLKPGTLLLRVWQGQTHHVMVTRDGYVWNGDPYGSLSTIAGLITGTSWNGWTFFGVKRPGGRNKNAAARRNRNGTARCLKLEAQAEIVLDAERKERSSRRGTRSSSTASCVPGSCRPLSPAIASMDGHPDA